MLLATGFGVGLSPMASGTIGSLLGIPIAMSIHHLNWTCQAGICVLLVLVAVPLCNVAEKHYGIKDDGRIVADEYLTFPICLIGIPWVEHLWLLPVAFVVSRVLDIIKPFPARRSQAFAGGAGIVMDDLISNLYTLALNYVICRMIDYL